MSSTTGIRVLASLLATACISASCALSQHVTPEAQGRLCAAALAPASIAGGSLSIDSDCILRVRDENGIVTGQLAVADLRSRQRTVRRIKATSQWLFVLYSNPGHIEAYELPTLARLDVTGMVRLREPVDMAFTEGVDGNVTAYIIDNAYDFERRPTSEEPVIGGEVVSVRLVRDKSAQRDLIVVGRVHRFGGVTSAWYDWRSLQSIDVDGGKLRVVINDNSHRYVAYYTFDGVLLDRQPLSDRR